LNESQPSAGAQHLAAPHESPYRDEIHDALRVEAPHEKAEQAKHLTLGVMTTAAKLRLPLEVDIE